LPPDGLNQADFGATSMPFAISLQPRFVIDKSQLKLVRSPYTDPLDVFLDNREGLSERLRNRLRRYDRFYFQSLYESPPLTGKLWVCKLFAFPPHET
jgi:hypothetical protein